MICVSVLVACLLSLPRSQAEPRTSTRRYRPVIQVTEEIDINDITFTTSAPDFHEASGYYNNAGKAHPSPSAYPHGEYKDSYGVPLPVDKSYTTGQPLVTPAIKYKPYKVLKVQEGLRPVPHKSPSYKGHAPGIKYSAKVVPFSSQLPSKSPTRASTFLTQDNKSFIPSPTFSPTVLSQINSQKFKEPSDVKPFATHRELDWPKPTNKPLHIKKGKKIPESHYLADVSGDFRATPEQIPSSPSPYKESPQQSESLLSEVSTAHKGGIGANNLDEVADSLDLKTGERVEFQMYGMDGPKSYKFGFDTGKGQNRHFRFEERDNTGKVKGHYGYLDEDGKMRIMKYEADPVTGFHAGPVEIPPDDN